MAGWTDAHNHLQDERLGPAAPVVAALRAAGVTRCVVNATGEHDWPAVVALARAEPDLVVPAFGIHPWHAHTAAADWPERLAGLLEKHPLAGLGECGLDSWVAAPSLEIQRPVFREHLRLARDLNRPVTIHCLKAWGVLIDMLAATPPPRFLLHSYGGSLETARRLLPLGAWFSVSGHFLHPRKAAALELFRQLPRERILLETDAPDMPPPDACATIQLDGGLNHPANLPAIGRALAAALGLAAEDFATQMRRNTDEFIHPECERSRAS